MRRLNLHKARIIISSGKDLSLSERRWVVPVDLLNPNRNNYWETFVSLGKWMNSGEKFIFVTTQGKPVYLSKEIVKKMWEAIK